MLRNLKLPNELAMHKAKVQKDNMDMSHWSSIDAEIACNLVDILFRHVLASIQTDRSSVKLNAFTKGMIGGVLGRTRDGTKEYVSGMNDSDIKLLLSDIEKELTKRKK